MTSAIAKTPLHPVAWLPDEWSAHMKKAGGRSFHASQVFGWLMQKGVLAPESMSNLPQTLRTQLKELGVGPVAEVTSERRSLDNTRKILLKLADGATVETVLIPMKRSGGRLMPEDQIEDADAAAAAMDEDDVADAPSPRTRVTQCISTQVGCAMGCVFCASGVAGLKRNMRPEEIVAQVLMGKHRLDEDEDLRNVVFMGMGEPLHNYEATSRALKLLTHPDGIGLSTRKVTVSTSGLVPEIRRLGEEFGGNIGLAISLHAADDETRTRLMPINKKYPLTELLPALRDYPLPKRRRITIEYTLIRGKNDSLEDARKLTKVLRGIPVKINLIPMNPIEASSLTPAEGSGVMAFQRVLVEAGYSCFIRRRRGDDVSAACGQLALLGAKPKVRVNRE